MKKIAFLFLFPLALFFGYYHIVSAETYTNTFTKEDKTYIVTKTIQDGKVIIETKIYDADGQLLKTEVIEKPAQPTPIKEIVYPTKTITKVPSITKVPETVTATPKSTSTATKHGSTFLETNLPLEVSTKSGNLIVKTVNGNKELLIGPDEVMKKAREQGLDIVAEIKLVQGTDGLQYQIKGTKQEKFLAISTVYLPTTLIYGVDEEGLKKVEQSTLVKLTDLLSI